MSKFCLMIFCRVFAVFCLVMIGITVTVGGQAMNVLPFGDPQNSAITDLWLQPGIFYIAFAGFCAFLAACHFSLANHLVRELANPTPA